MEYDSRRLMIPDIAFHRISTRPILWKSAPPPLGIITTVCQAHDASSYPPLKPACMITTTFSQLPGLEFSSRFAARCHILRCLAFIPEGPPAQCSRSRVTSPEI